MKKFLVLAAAVALTAAASLSARASSVYDAAADFSTTNNPGVVWSYGEYNNGSIGVLNPADFRLFTQYRNLGSAYPTLQEWYNGSPTTDPNVIYNNGVYDVTSLSHVDFQSGKLSLGPWLGPTVVRFTTPIGGDGYYDISATFMTVQTVNTAPTAYVYVNGILSPGASSLLIDPSNQLLGTPWTYSATNVLLTAGQHVDFVVWGSNSANKTTQLDATITGPELAGNSTPLPAAAGIGFSMLGGFGALFAVRKRMSRKARIA
jgi:hypothetical protein